MSCHTPQIPFGPSCVFVGRHEYRASPGKYRLVFVKCQPTFLTCRATRTVNQLVRHRYRSTCAAGQTTRHRYCSTCAVGQTTRHDYRSTSPAGQTTRGIYRSTCTTGQTTRHDYRSTCAAGQTTRGTYRLTYVPYQLIFSKCQAEIVRLPFIPGSSGLSCLT
jgi:hypothetical protein